LLVLENTKFQTKKERDKKEKEKNLEMSSICDKAFTLFFVLAIAMPIMCQGWKFHLFFSFIFVIIAFVRYLFKNFVSIESAQ
jgi:hypothetical protein